MFSNLEQIDHAPVQFAIQCQFAGLAQAQNDGRGNGFGQRGNAVGGRCAGRHFVFSIGLSRAIDVWDLLVLSAATLSVPAHQPMFQFMPLHRLQFDSNAMLHI